MTNRYLTKYPYGNVNRELNPSEDPKINVGGDMFARLSPFLGTKDKSYRGQNSTNVLTEVTLVCPRQRVKRRRPS